MARIITIILYCVILNKVYSQKLPNNFRVPIQIKGIIGIGYDNNYLRLSNKEISSNIISKHNVYTNIESPLYKVGVKFIYSPIIIDKKITNLITSFTYNYYSNASFKSYLITRLFLEYKIANYSWIKIGIRNIPKYYLREYVDRDISLTKYRSEVFNPLKEKSIGEDLTFGIVKL